ncbi:MAG: response regulator transcription factor [Saprospiraceae bacterium]|nr:response regulator transcription factor [Saprospiraceae bacterium]
MNNIYYVEDDKRHFDALRTLLKTAGYNVFPLEQNWESEFASCISFIRDQSNAEKKAAFESIIQNVKPDLLIIDVGLNVDAFGDGQDIYKNLILKSDSLKNIPIIYLTIIGKKSIQLFKNTNYVQKVYKLQQELDIDSIEQEMLNTISTLLKPSSSKGFMDSIIDSI